MLYSITEDATGRGGERWPAEAWRERVRSAADVPSFPKLAEPLTDGVVVLRPSVESDIPEILIAYQDDPDLFRALGEPKPPSGAELGRRAELAEADRAAGRRLTFTVLRAGSDDFCGEVRVDDVDWERGIASVIVWIAAQARGQGLARAAVLVARDWLWRECGLDATPVI